MKNLISSKIAILIIGNEILSGKTQDTNSRFLASQLQTLGYELGEIRTVHDQPTEIVSVLHHLSQKYRLILVSGGLGPTHDDVTSEALSRWAHVPLISHPNYYKNLKKRAKSYGKFYEPAIYRQSLVPQNCELLGNPAGVARGLLVRHQNTAAIAMPGVPQELESMFETSIRPWLLKSVKRASIFVTTIRTAGVAESHLMSRLNGLIQKEKEVEVGFYPEVGEVAIQLKSLNQKKLLQLKRKIVSKISKSIYGFDTDNLEMVIGKMLLKKRLNLACAESCTGGLLSKRLTDVPGASRYFWGGIVSYDNRVKEGILGVSRAILGRFGAVSEPCVQAMAKGVRGALKTSFGVAITGIAGPSGGSRSKPVGLTFIAISWGSKTKVHRFVFRGDRSQVRKRATQLALILLWQTLKRS